jgi:hypothetical protein
MPSSSEDFSGFFSLEGEGESVERKERVNALRSAKKCGDTEEGHNSHTHVSSAVNTPHSCACWRERERERERISFRVCQRHGLSRERVRERNAERYSLK